MAASTRVGVDVGGTFTDIVAVRDGRVTVVKAPSASDAPARGVSTGIESIADRGEFELKDIRSLVHGTTVATNAVIERSWAPTALVTTDGFRDAIEIRRQNRPDLYDFGVDKPEPVVEREYRFEVPERLNERGRIITELDEEAVRAIGRQLDDVESVAIALLFSFENDDHEQRVEELLKAEADVTTSVSSQVLPEIREYERMVATALDAALKPVMDQYLGELKDSLDRAGISAGLRLMQSNGGRITAETARERPLRTLLSGPAAGVQGAAFLARRGGRAHVMTMDMGGTSCDVSLVRNGEPVTTSTTEIGDYPVGVPAIDVHSIGAGGGSIAWVDEGDALRVGPRSAGADPGPVCYGRGGTEPTVTDAHFLLGRIDPAKFGHGFSVDRNRVRKVFEERVADPLGMTVSQVAQGIIEVANANMERALRVVSVERGHDPREFALIAFGGAGPLHACSLAANLDIPEVLVPRLAGVLSAVGLLVSDVVYDFSISRVRPWRDVKPADLAEQFGTFRDRGEKRLTDEGIPTSDRRFERALDVRYAGQSFDLSIPVPSTPSKAVLEDVADRFHERHEQRYGHASPGEPIELVTVRLRARGLIEEPNLVPTDAGTTIDDAIVEERSVGFEGSQYETTVYDGTTLPIEAELSGPAIIEGAENTLVVQPDQQATIDGDGNAVVDV